MMKSFLLKSSVFVLLLVIIVTTICSSFNWYVGKKTYFKLDKSITSVVFGHSHSETAYNDSLITNFKNLAQSGDTYFNTYIKAKMVLRQNPQIKTVFIEFTNIDVTQFRDEEIWEDRYMNWKYPMYAAIMDTEEHLFLLSKNPISLIKALPKTYKKQFDRIIESDYSVVNDISGYKYLTEAKLDSLLKTKNNLKSQKNSFFKKSINNLTYLEKTLVLCKEHGVKVYFVRSPLYKESYYVSNETLFNNVRKDKFADIEFLDFSNFPIANDEFRDLNHLNYKGAEKFSKWFNKRLQENSINNDL